MKRDKGLRGKKEEQQGWGEGALRRGTSEGKKQKRSWSSKERTLKHQKGTKWQEKGKGTIVG